MVIRRTGMFSFFLDLPRAARRFMLLALDGVAVILSMWIAFDLRLGQWWPPMLAEAWLVLPLSLVVSLPLFWGLGFYRSVLRYAGRDLFYTLLRGVGLSVLLMMACWLVIRGAIVPRSIWPLAGIVQIALIGGGRLLLRDLLLARFAANVNRKRVLIYGAGVGGVQLASALKHDPEYMPVAFVDDSDDLHNSVVAGLRVYQPVQLSRLVQREHVDAILLAIPSASRRQRRAILDRLTPLSVRLMVMPSVTELASGAKRIDELRQVDVEDILGRDPIKPRRDLLDGCLRGQVILVTGAGGSIGSELCRQILQLGPKCLLLLDLSEYALYRIERDLRDLLDSMDQPPKLVTLLGSVTQVEWLGRIMRDYSVQTVYHAAAYKHVPLVEQNVFEGIRNNIGGTVAAAEAAIDAGVETFVFISTDKAVRPSNIMGATKRFAELVLQGLSQRSSSVRFCIVRFGNVLGSSGSVVPLFREQIRRGGPVTVTHPDVTRYFMTIPEAAQLVIQAGAMAEGGDLFLLDMGEPVHILHLARRMIELSGFQVRDDHSPNGDIEIRFTGLRPGEKLHEELLIGADNSPTAHPMIKRAREESLPWPLVRRYLDRLTLAERRCDRQALLDTLWDAVGVLQRPHDAVPLLTRPEGRSPVGGGVRLSDKDEDEGRQRLSAQ